MRARSVVASLALLGALAAAGCEKTANRLLGIDPDDDEISTATFFVEPGIMTFDHVVRESPCPQLVGRFLLRNLGGGERIVRIAPQAPLFTVPDGARVSPGRVVEVEVYFDCSTQRSFVSEIQVTSPTGEPVGKVLVEGTVTGNVL